MKKWINWLIFAVSGFGISLFTIIFEFTILPIAIRYQVNQQLALLNGTEAWERFVYTPIPLILRVYFFNLENPDGLIHGEKAKVKQIGPYVYRETWEKVDIRIDEEKDRVFFRQKIDYRFDKELSGNLSDTDIVSIVNPLVHIIPDLISGFPTLNLVNELIDHGLPEILGKDYGPVLNASVRDILFDGYNIPCGNKSLSFVAKLFCDIVYHFAPLPNLEPTPDGDIILSLIKFKELTPFFEMIRGIKEPERLGRVISLDGKSKLDSWWCDSANVVNGYDMTLMSPFAQRTSIPLFIYDIQTTVELPYEEDSDFNGINGYKFVLGPDLFGDPAINSKSKCYCPGAARKLTVPTPCNKGHGAIDLSSPLGIPALLSNPHFYGASENYQEMVEGLHPEKELHESYLKIEPTTGVPLQGRRRIQANVKTTKKPFMKLLKNHTDAVIPIAWIDEGADLGGKEISMIKDQLLFVLKIVNIGMWSLFVLGIIFIGIGSTMAVIRKREEV